MGSATFAQKFLQADRVKTQQKLLKTFDAKDALKSR